MAGNINEALIFLITSVFNIFIILLIIRLILAWVHADYHHRITQVVTTLTDTFILPLRRVIKNIGGLETSTLLFIFVLEIIKYLLILWIPFGFPNLLGVLLLAFADTIGLTLQVFFYSILIQAVISFIQPATPILEQFNSPIMRPFQKMVKPVKGIDISPIFALIVIQLLIILAIKPLIAMGLDIAVVAQVANTTQPFKRF